MDNLSIKQRSANMRAVKSCNTEPEKIVRRLSHKLGYRFRLQASNLPCKPDIVFPGRRKVIFVHGCFWHHHSCKHGSQTPKTNTSFWREKITKNVERDTKDLTRLRKAGWRVLVVWECQTKTPNKLASRLERFLA